MSFSLISGNNNNSNAQAVDQSHSLLSPHLSRTVSAHRQATGTVGQVYHYVYENSSLAGYLALVLEAHLKGHV